MSMPCRLNSSTASGVRKPAASATLVYGVQPNRGAPSVWVANNDGSGATRLATGYGGPTISPDGTTVAALRQTSSGGSSLSVFPATGGSSSGVRGGFYPPPAAPAVGC